MFFLSFELEKNWRGLDLPISKAVILTCLPLLGAQIAKITGTLNLLNEKAKEGRD